MKKAIIYGRVSTNKQSSESVETQIYECKKWASENNCTVVDIYDDSGQSGQEYNVGNRSGFQQIKHDAMRGRMDFALIHKIDRFARSAQDYFSQEKILAQYNVKIVVVGMPFLNDADIITKSVHIAFAEQFSVNLSNEVSTKMRTFARKKAFLGGKPPYGYTVAPTDDGGKTLEINVEEAQGVKMIYQLYLQGFGYVQISKIIAQNGFLNAKNEPFTPTHIRKILTSKKYNGWYVFGIREKVKGKDQKTTNTEKLIELPDAHDKIIDDETFATVQNKIKSNVPKNKRKKRHYPFTGRIVCGCCGRAWTGSSTVKRDRKKSTYVYYRCTGYKVNECKVPAVSAVYLEAYVAEKVKSHLFDDNFTADLIHEIEFNLSGDVASFQSVKNRIEKELAQKKSQIKEALKDKYNRKGEQDIAEELIAEMTEERAVLETRLVNVQQQLNINDKTGEIKKYVKWLKNNLEKAEDDIKSALLQQVVQSIVVYAERIDVFVFISQPIGEGKRHYKGLPNVKRGEPLFTLDKQHSSAENSLSNINSGVPREVLDEHGNVYTSNGLDLISFSVHR